MPQCDKVVEIRQKKEPSDDAFIVHCIDGLGHDGKHQGHVWVLGKNKATGDKGVASTIWWED